MKRIPLTAQGLGALMQHHGNPTHYIIMEGGIWRRVPMGDYTYLLRITYLHAIRFAMNGAVWDEINGIRPKNMWLTDSEMAEREL